MREPRFKAKFTTAALAAAATVADAVNKAAAPPPFTLDHEALDTAIKEAALKIPIKEAMNQLAERLTADLERELLVAIERKLCEKLEDPTVLQGRLMIYPDDALTAEEERGETYVLDDVPILWVGPVRLVRAATGAGDTMQGARSFRHLQAEAAA